VKGCSGTGSLRVRLLGEFRLDCLCVPSARPAHRRDEGGIADEKTVWHASPTGDRLEEALHGVSIDRVGVGLLY